MARVLLIGLDGFEPSLAQRWMDEGVLPNLRMIAEAGSMLACASTVPASTLPAWTTCVTGVNPGRHGVFDFTEVIGGHYAIRFTDASRRMVPALWQILSKAGKRVAVLGVPGTYPPDSVNGVMVSGFDSPVATRVRPSCVYPRSRYPDFREWRYADFQERRLGPNWYAMALDRLVEGIAAKQRIACRLFREESWDFMMLVFGESDTVAHHFWRYHDPASPRYEDSPYRHAIRQVYACLDEAIGALVQAADTANPGDWSVVIVSDHGFGGSGTGVIHLNNRLAETGLLRFTGADHGSFWKEAALRLVPTAWQGGILCCLNGTAACLEGKARFSGIDWQNTKAWSEELNYFPSIRINLEGREPNGQVAAAEYTAFRDSLRDELTTWTWVKKAWTRNELYQGPYIHRAPDIILELESEDGYAVSCLRRRGGPSFRRMDPREYPGGRERGHSGVHRPQGVLFLSERPPSVIARLMDIAPTVLSRMEVDTPPMEGRDLFDAQIHEPPIETVMSEANHPFCVVSGDHLIEKRLRDLGYLE